MNCPFCDEDIKDRALVCKHCGRDLSILRPVLDRFESLETRLAAVETALHKLSSHVETARPDNAATGAATGIRSAVDLAETGKTLSRLALLIALLLAAHWVIVGILDLDTWVLRIVSILVPLPFGMIGPRSPRATIWTAIVAAVVSVWGMLAITGAIDQVPILPQGSRDWLETLEYAASIALAFGTGRLVSEWLTVRKTHTAGETSLVYEIAKILVRSSAPKNETRVHAKQRVESLANWLNILALIITAGCSIATGVGRFFH